MRLGFVLFDQGFGVGVGWQCFSLEKGKKTQIENEVHKGSVWIELIVVETEN